MLSKMIFLLNSRPKKYLKAAKTCSEGIITFCSCIATIYAVVTLILIAIKSGEAPKSSQLIKFQQKSINIGRGM
jgi:hypothetical protein